MAITVWCEKGGSGKTTTAVTLAELSALHRPTVLIDADPQATATRWTLGHVPAGASSFDVLTGKASILDAAVPSPGLPGLDVVPAHASLAQLPDDVDPAAVRAVVEAYDGLVIIDGPAAWGRLSAVALAAAERVVVPLRPSALDLDSFTSALARLEDVRASLNPGLTVAAIVIAAYDGRASIGPALIAHISEQVPGVPVLRIPSAVVAAMAPGARQGLAAYAPLSPPTLAYRHLAEQLGIGGPS